MKAVLTTKQGSVYDDVPEIRYHFPRTYLRQIEQTVGDLIVYYEPRRVSTEDTSRGGRQAYFAVARVTKVIEDPFRHEHYYAQISDYIDFDLAVPFQNIGVYFERGLRRSDGGTNRGAFGRAVRLISDEEFEEILRAGFSYADTELTIEHGFEEEQLPFQRPIIEQVVKRQYRDQRFASHVRGVYQRTCAITGLSLVNGNGRAEVQAAHIQPVAAYGPDSVRNGLALSGTIHWMFDRGLISIDDDYRLLRAEPLIPPQLRSLFRPDGHIFVPEPEHLKPHPIFLRFHRENVFKG